MAQFHRLSLRSASWLRMPRWTLSDARVRVVAVLTLAVAATAAMYVPKPQVADGASSAATVDLTRTPPSPPPLILRPLPPSTALAINRAIPLAPGPNPPAQPFRFSGGAANYDRALSCLSSAIYYEAASEPDEGQQAVAQVILNRVRHPAFPASICAVVYQGSTLRTGCQFTFTCDGALNRPQVTQEWARAQAVAVAALAGRVFAPVGYATHYHANFVVPYWATSLAKNGIVGTHIFYRWRGVWGEARAFRRPYAAAEANPVMLRAVALAAREQRGTDIRPDLPAPDIAIRSDPRVEMFNIVAMLAKAAPGENETPYEKEVRDHFGQYADRLAVQIYRQLASEDAQFATSVVTQLAENPAPTDVAAASLDFPDFILPGRSKEVSSGLSEALRDFAEHTDFVEFFAKQKPYYDALSETYRSMASPLVTRFETYTGSGAGSISIVVAPLLQHALVADCGGGDAAPNEPMVLLLPQARPDTAESEQLLQYALIGKALGRQDCRVRTAGGDCSKGIRGSAAQDLIARTMAGRMAQLGTPEQRKPKFTGIGLAVAEAFQTYEGNRTWFPTFDHFRPVLLETVSASAGNSRGAGAGRSGATACSNA